MSKQFVADLKERDSVHSIFLVRDKASQTGKTGKSYLNLTLSDRTGQIDGRVWDNAEEIGELFEAEDFVLVKGTVQSFQNRRQLVVHALEVASSGDVDISQFLPTAKRSSEEMMKELLELLQQIKNPFVKNLVLSTLNDPEIRPLYLSCPAAKTIHHAYIGGLLEHSLSISRIMVFLASHYPELDLDLLLFGAVFHDIGKIWELKFETAIGYTDVGRLVGHIPLGAELVEKKASEISHFPFELKIVLKHIILSHHGKYEYGSPKLPSFPEAMIVGMIDDLDSKVNCLVEFLRGERANGEKWTRVFPQMERNIFTGTGHWGAKEP